LFYWLCPERRDFTILFYWICPEWKLYNFFFGSAQREETLH
jgi:hypothetical protein